MMYSNRVCQKLHDEHMAMESETEERLYTAYVMNEEAL
jgi:hypothetical protein